MELYDLVADLGLDDEEEVSFLLSDGSPTEYLLSRTREAADLVEEPDSETGLAPPEVIVWQAAPYVGVTIAKMSDFRSALDVVGQQLTKILGPNLSVRLFEPDTVPYVGAFLELRIALAGERIGFDWSVDPSATTAAEEAVLDWLAGQDSQRQVYFSTPGGEYPVPATHRLAALRLARSDGLSVTFTSVLDESIRAIHWSPRSGHVSLISGTAEQQNYNWQASLLDLREHSRSLIPIADAGLIRFCSDLATTGASAYFDRHRQPRASGHYADAKQQRETEHAGRAADVEGVLLLPEPKVPLPGGWQSTMIDAHLSEIRADNLDAWFAGYPTPDVLSRARDDLSFLIGE